MIEQEIEKLYPRGYVINVLQRDIKRARRIGRQEHTTATRLRLSLAEILKAFGKMRKRGVGINPAIQNRIDKAAELLNVYTVEVDKLISLIEDAIKKTQIQHLDVIRKIESISDLIKDTRIDYLRIKGKFPFSPSNSKNRKAIMGCDEELGDLQQSIADILSGQHQQIRRVERSERRIARGRSIITPLRLHLVSRNWDEQRNAKKERVYLLNEENLLSHIKSIREKFLAEREQISNLSQFTQYDLERLSQSKLEQLAYLIYSFVYDVKNLLDFYKGHLGSLTNLQIDLELEDADTLRELDAIIELLEKLTTEHQGLESLNESKNKLVELKKKILVLAQYNYKRDQYIDKNVIVEFLKGRRLKKHEVEYDSGYKSTVHSYRITLPGARTGMIFTKKKRKVAPKIRGEIFIKDPKNIPNRGVIIVTSFTAYRQLYNNMASFFAEDNYLVLLYDPPSHGESRGIYGNAEGSQNIFTMARYLKGKFGLQKIAVAGYSMGGNQTLFSSMYYDLEVESVIMDIIEKEGNLLSKVNLIKIFGKKDYLSSLMKEIQKNPANREKIREAILRSYQRNGNLIDTFLILNPFLVKFLGQGSNIMYHIFRSSKVGSRLFKYIMESKKTVEDLPEDYEDIIRHKDAFERYMRMVKKKDPERYKKLKKIKPIFSKGMSIFNRDEFFKEFNYAMFPIDYLDLIEQVCPEMSGYIYKAPKLFIYSNDDEITLFRKNQALYLSYPKRFGNSQVQVITGFLHHMSYPTKTASADVQIKNVILNYLHQYLKYHL